ncbi:MAG: nucleoside-diphosphate kinase [Candidatus Micrarchaeota archaeon]
MEKAQRSVVFIKPHVLNEHGLEKGREIFDYLDEKLAETGEFTVLAEKEVFFSVELSRQHYRAHLQKPFYPELEQAVTQGKAMVLARAYEGPNIIARIRKVVGATDPAKAEEGTIRRKYAKSITFNAIHASGDEKDAEWEIKLHFPELVEE